MVHGIRDRNGIDARRMAVALRALVIAGLCGSCQPAPVAALPVSAPVDGVGYLIFTAPIVPSSRDAFIRDIDKLHSAGANEIQIGMSSPGGDIDSAQAMVDYMGRLHSRDGVTFKLYNIGLVGSAASYVFLNAQERYSAPKSVFIFHAASAHGPADAQSLREQLDKLDGYERAVRAAMKAHTKLSDADALVYVRRTVLLNADDAKRDGVVSAISNFAPPKDYRGWIIQANPATKAAAAAGTSPTP